MKYTDGYGPVSIVKMTVSQSLLILQITHIGVWYSCFTLSAYFLKSYLQCGQKKKTIKWERIPITEDWYIPKPSRLVFSAASGRTSPERWWERTPTITVTPTFAILITLHHNMICASSITLICILHLNIPIIMLAAYGDLGKSFSESLNLQIHKRPNEWMKGLCHLCWYCSA